MAQGTFLPIKLAFKMPELSTMSTAVLSSVGSRRGPLGQGRRDLVLYSQVSR